jgi:hypothetical protein
MQSHGESWSNSSSHTVFGHIQLGNQELMATRPEFEGAHTAIVLNGQNIGPIRSL